MDQGPPPQFLIITIDIVNDGAAIRQGDSKPGIQQVQQAVGLLFDPDDRVLAGD